MLATSELIEEAAQFSRVENLLPRWREVPLYRELVASGKFSEAPFITKQDMRRDFPNNFLRERRRLDELLDQQLVEIEYTSGTSTERTPVVFGRGWWNEQEARVLRLNALVARALDENPGARRATLVPPVCNGTVCFSNWAPPSARTVGATLFVNQARIPFVLPESDLARMAGEVADWSPWFLDLDPVHGVWFALFCERNGIRFPSVKFILCSYEFVSVVHRRIIERVFRVPVFNLYGATETGHLLMENERREMKPCYQNVFYEITNCDERGVGDLVVTTLTNEYMPLLRYQIGDLVERVELPYATSFLLHGRSADVLSRSDGARVTTLDVDQCFRGVSGIAHYQLSQSETGAVHLQFIPDLAPPEDGRLSELRNRIESLLQRQGPLKIESVAMLPPTPSGKFRLTRRV